VVEGGKEEEKKDSREPGKQMMVFKKGTERVV